MSLPVRCVRAGHHFMQLHLVVTALLWTNLSRLVLHQPFVIGCAAKVDVWVCPSDLPASNVLFECCHFV
eukprot:SAG31_NODE_31550_length_367_cov_0.473881_1_plen_68_part_10